MPELPEVETIRRGLEPHLVGACIQAVQVGELRLREQLPGGLLAELVDGHVLSVRRRAKYLLLDSDRAATIVVHLGMSGRLTFCTPEAPLEAHTHVRWWLDGGGLERQTELRFRDPRRFGLVLVVPTHELTAHRLFCHLGPEPFARTFSARYLLERARNSKRAVKTFLMDARVVTGIGNIYASELLWRSRVRPTTPAGRLSLARWQRIRAAAVEVLTAAIDAGGTTLSDFRSSDGSAGYFAVQLDAYGRAGEPCTRCGSTVRRMSLGGRSTFYCARCQR